jgi:transcriptional regulator with XRE-family HTH domain
MSDAGQARPRGAPEATVGETLRQLRRKSRLTGQGLADLVGMSQAKISRIENGVGVVAPSDIVRIARALDAPQDLVDHMMEQAERLNDRMTDWRSSHGAVASLQREVAELEAATQVFRVFQPAVIVGLAQTSEYARAVLGATHEIRSKVAVEGGVAAVPEAISVRVRRQEVLAEPDKRFHFLMLEGVLSARFARPEDMVAQINRLRELSEQENIALRIIPSDAPLPIPPYHGFELLDDRIVIVDVFNTLITTRGNADIALYRVLFDRLEEIGTEEVHPILDRYVDLYLDLSRPRHHQDPHRSPG